MYIRIISALLGIPLFLFVMIRGGMILDTAVAILSMVAMKEFFNAFENIDIHPNSVIGMISSAFLFLLTIKEISVQNMMLWIFVTMLLILIGNLFYKKPNILGSTVTAAGIFYIIFFMYHIVFIAHANINSHWIWLIFIVAWATDTFAYFVGYLLGKKKLCPAISPKKTVEGAIGGIVGSIIMSGVFGYFMIPVMIKHCLFIGLIGSIGGQMGDLTASIFKRYTNIKDYGKIMPGHGGILDRFDSILFTAPIVYYYTIFVI